MAAVKRRAATDHIVLTKTCNHNVIARAGLDIVGSSRCRDGPCPWTDQHQIRLTTALRRGGRIEEFTSSVDIAVHQHPEIICCLVTPDPPACAITGIKIGIDLGAAQHRRIDPCTFIKRTSLGQLQCGIPKD